jgi:hypothetical protein
MPREKIEIPSDFYGFGDEPGQCLAGEVLEHDDEGGETQDGKVVPQTRFRLLEDTVTYSEKGTVVTQLKAGEEITYTASQAQAQRKVKKAHLKPGDKVWITLTGKFKTANGTAKSFEVEIERVPF